MGEVTITFTRDERVRIKHLAENISIMIRQRQSNDAERFAAELKELLKDKGVFK